MDYEVETNDSTTMSNNSSMQQEKDWHAPLLTTALQENYGRITEVTPEHSLSGDDDDEMKSSPIFQPGAAIPPRAIEVLEKIHEDPLPRTKLMGQVISKLIPVSSMTDLSILTAVSVRPRRPSLLHHLAEPSSTNQSKMVAISSVPEQWFDPTSMGMGGVGKTTLAAMVASHGDVRKYFDQGIAWVHVGSQQLNYQRYCSCLEQLCSQLLTSPFEMPVFPVLVKTPCEAKSIRERREVGFMTYAKDVVSDLLENRKVLIILDSVEYPLDLEWFHFVSPAAESGSMDTGGTPPHRSVLDESASPSILVVSRRRDLIVGEKVEVDLLYEAEAIRLMVTESGQTLDRSVTETREARMVVQNCANHPLAVKSVGRWLSLKHAKNEGEGVFDSLQELAKVLDDYTLGDDNGDTMYEVLRMAFSPSVNGQPTRVIKFCFAAFCTVFCSQEHHSLLSALEEQPIVPMELTELLFKAVLQLEQETLKQEGTMFFEQLFESTMLITEALSALGVIKVFHPNNNNLAEEDNASSDMSDTEFGSSSHKREEEEAEEEEEVDPMFVQIIHGFFQEYGEYLSNEDQDLMDLTLDKEERWNKAFVDFYFGSRTNAGGWATQQDSSRDYALELLVSHMMRANMLQQAQQLLLDSDFVQARVECMGRENATRQHITDCEAMHEKMEGTKKEKRSFLEGAYKILGNQLGLDEDSDEDEEDDNEEEEGRSIYVETGRAHYDIGLSLAEKRYWHAAIHHWETAQEILVSSLGVEEFVAAVLYNTGVAHTEANKHKKALSFLKRCLQIRGAIHGEKHTLFGHTIQKIGDVFLAMSQYQEAMDCFAIALDILNVAPNYHRLEIGDALENVGNIHYGKGELFRALRCYQDSLRSKKMELGNDNAELARIYQHIGDCLSDMDRTEEAIVHFEEAMRLRKLDEDEEQEADLLCLEGVLYGLRENQEASLECYEKALNLLAARAPHKRAKIASLMHLVGCVYLVNEQHDNAMRYFQASLDARRRIHGYTHLEVASTFFNVAFLHQLCDRLEESLNYLQDALKIRQQLLPDSEKVVLTLEKIGILANEVGDKEQAEASLQEALRIRKKLHGDDHELVAAIVHEIGVLNDDMGDYEEALKYLTQALEIRRAQLGDDHEDVASTLYSIGFTLFRMDETDRSLQYFDEALSMQKGLFGDDSKEVAETLNMIGFLEAKRGKMENALSVLWDALRIRKSHGDIGKVAEILKNIGNVHREKKEYELATECYEECLRIRRTEFGSQDFTVAESLIAIGDVRSETGETEEAINMYEEATSILTAVYGERDLKVLEVTRLMGVTEFKAGNLTKAQEHLDEYVSARIGNEEEQDEDVVDAYFMLGNIHKMQGRKEEAMRFWTAALRLFGELDLSHVNPQLGDELESVVAKESQ